MKRQWVIASVALGSVFAASFAAHAGLKNNSNVVNITGTEFSGALGVVRNSPSSSEYLYCSVTGGFAACYAKNAAGTTRQCRASDAGFKNMVMAINDDSYVRVTYTFSACAEPSGTACCTGIEVANGSEYAPKAP
jgi:hypothetical protein